MKLSKFAIAASAVAALAATGFANAAPILVATISAQYAASGDDTPHIFINNSTMFSFTNVRLSGLAYNGANSLLAAGTDIDKSDNSGGAFHRTQVKNLADIGVGVNFDYRFSDGPAACGPGASNQGDLFATDYDDTYGCVASAQPGNVLFTFTAMWNGQSIFAQFSPDMNETGHFSGFLGLDETGNAESAYDSGGGAGGAGTGALGTMANIFVGAPPGIPEPLTLALVGLGLAGIGLTRRRKSA